MARKHNQNNPLQIRIEAVNIPKSVKPETYLERLMQNITEGRPVPPRWEVRIHWRNPKTKHGITKRWRYDSFEDAIAESRSGFGDIVYAALSANLRRVRAARMQRRSERRSK